MVNAVLSNAVNKPTRDICALETVVAFPHIQISLLLFVCWRHGRDKFLVVCKPFYAFSNFYNIVRAYGLGIWPPIWVRSEIRARKVFVLKKCTGFEKKVSENFRKITRFYRPDIPRKGVSGEPSIYISQTHIPPPPFISCQSILLNKHKKRTQCIPISFVKLLQQYSSGSGVEYRFHGLYKVLSQPLKAPARCWKPPLFPIPRTIGVGEEEEGGGV